MTDGEYELVESGLQELAALQRKHGCSTLTGIIRASPEARRIAQDLHYILESVNARHEPLRSDPAEHGFMLPLL